LSDLTRSGELPAALTGLLAWVACIADARAAEEYVAHLERAEFQSLSVEPHNEALAQMARDIQGGLLAAELMVRLDKISLPGVDFAEFSHEPSPVTSRVETQAASSEREPRTEREIIEAASIPSLAD
jgi:hypothetical protein